MNWTIKHKSNLLTVGAKAKNLFVLKSNGFNVPEFLVIPFAFFQSTDANKTAELVDELKDYFGNNSDMLFAVRSSSTEEDSDNFSFAGQFDTFLNIQLKEVPNYIEKVFQSANSERVETYRTINNINGSQELAVIVQVMVNSDVSAVGFSRNPNDSDKDEQIINSVYGLGEGLVSGDLNADSYHVKNGKVDTQLAAKKFKYTYNNFDTVKVKLPLKLSDESTLTNSQIKEVTSRLRELELLFKCPQDVELAYFNNELHFLQSRPITVRNVKPEGEYILWDNSNIIESYPGITSPLTFSFIEKMYAKVYSQMAGLMGVSKKQIEAKQQVFLNTLGLVNGRVYYNLLSWYKMLAMVPGYSLNARFMEKMMGVKERFDLTDNYKMNKFTAWMRIIVMLFKMIVLQIRLPKERKRFTTFVSQVFKKYQELDYDAMTDKQVVDTYSEVENILLNKWKAPLINDFFTMIWFGVLEKKVKSLAPEYPNLHNDILCGSSDIISVEPLYFSFRIVELIKKNETAVTLFKTKEASTILATLNEVQFSEISSQVKAYLAKFGDRCVGELKLENLSYTQNPEGYIDVLKSYIRENVKINNNNIENKLREDAEQIISEQLKGKFLKQKTFNFILKNARSHVSGRENLRFERTKAFGLIRKIVLVLGEKWKDLELINDSKDIFYLELGEVLAFEKLKSSFKNIIEARKNKYVELHSKEPAVERFYSYGKNFSDNYIYSTEKLVPLEGDLSGIGCCPGRVRGKVRVVIDPKEIKSLDGDILVTTSTDPGWITLFPSASAIIVERGSLLSHSAIVSREMGIPCIVGVSGLLRSLKTGDVIEMDGSTGEIKQIEAEI
jgi:rifampicin phosphotransferase